MAQGGRHTLWHVFNLKTENAGPAAVLERTSIHRSLSFLSADNAAKLLRLSALHPLEICKIEARLENRCAGSHSRNSAII